MMDAYTHLDMSAADPLEDLRNRLSSASLERALIVETWSGDNREIVEEISNCEVGQFDIAFCYRDEPRMLIEEALRRPAMIALRARTGVVAQVPEWLSCLEQSGKLLLVHAESGIRLLANALEQVAYRYPQLRIYIPHLAWPRCDKQNDPDWLSSVDRLSKLSNCVLGVSAIQFFSEEVFPHEDIRAFASYAIEAFGAQRLMAASDYPLMEKSRYADYVRLARKWIHDVWSDWSNPSALRA